METRTNPTCDGIDVTVDGIDATVTAIDATVTEIDATVDESDATVRGRRCILHFKLSSCTGTNIF